jgi:type I restriction-modification system DNA methylase subunit
MLEKIQNALNQFSDGNLTENALNFFRTLGYESERQMPFDDKSFAEFKDRYIEEDSGFNENNALVEEWRYVDLLFQITEDELSSQNLIFSDKTIDQRITSYLFFVIELKEQNYSRTKLSQITREVNKVFQIPVMILFKYGECVTLAVIDRRPNKRDESKDVLRKVTLIKDINIHRSHRAHLDILEDLSLSEIKSNHSIRNFLDLHNAWQKTLDVEIVTNKFFRDYKVVFEQVEREVKESIPDAETARLFTQRLFNRLMFIYFIQKKGWLRFEGETNYLRRIFTRAEINGENFYKDRLYWVFFYGLSNPFNSKEIHDEESLKKKRGDVEYLNGGLFELEKDGFDEKTKMSFSYDEPGKVSISNARFGEILDLFEKYNFTVEESTPYEIQVAIDPEILGRVFEELVTGRHESGSYYTPRQIVSFMCRESLKYYLAPFDTPETIAEFVDEGKGENLKNPEKILDALKKIRICDPACGSGAYLLGMMQELLTLRQSLFASKHIGDASLYNRKREIIENNIYGVDKDRFAVQIASLRLWLSLAIESNEPRPLPNLKYKIGCGDSLLAPLENDLQPDMHRQALIEQFRARKADYGKAHNYKEKSEIDVEIKRLRVEIARMLKRLPEPSKPYQIKLAENQVQPLRDKIQRCLNRGEKFEAEKFQKELNKLLTQIEEWKSQASVEHYDTGEIFDWTVEFAEVFADGGFDVVLANPPFIRQELLGRDYKENHLKPNFPEVYSGTADIYVYFFARANAMLKENGVGCFISSNKWLRAGYGEKLRQYLLDNKKFHLVVDFGELPVFKAATFPAIFLWQNAERQDTPTNWAVVKDLQACYDEGIREHIAKLSETLPASQFGIGSARLTSIHKTNMREVMENSGLRLNELPNIEILNGVKTGFNKAFIMNEDTKNKLISDDENNTELIKPTLIGSDVRRYEINFRSNYLLYITWDLDITKYPTIQNYLSSFRSNLEKRDGVKNGGPCPWYALSRPRPETKKYFESTKIVYSKVGKSPRFSLDIQGIFPNDTIFSIPITDYFLLAVLNSTLVFEYLKIVCAVFGDEESGGRLIMHDFYVETLPIPNASDDERETIGNLAKETQNLHTARRARVEQFLLDVGTSAAESSSRNPLERPWEISEEEFLRRTRSRYDVSIFRQTRDETFELTEQINKIEQEIDERVAELYGVKLESL